MDGGGFDLFAYAELFGQMSSFGMLVCGTYSCNMGCQDAHKASNARWTSCGGLPPLAPLGMGWDAYYAEAFKIIDWARNATVAGDSDPFFSMIDWDAGVGVVGHSMGGQGAAQAATGTCPQQWGVRAAVLHHPANGQLPWGNIGENMSIPVAGYTSSGDSIWPETQAIMNAFNKSGLPAAYRNEEGWSHLEPILWPPCENPLLATYTVAWLKAFLKGQDPDGAWKRLVFGSPTDQSTLCGHAKMAQCYAVNG
jgi:hypothetical protein